MPDDVHMDQCAWINCHDLDHRRNMHRIKGKRGYFCTFHFELWNKLNR